MRVSDLELGFLEKHLSLISAQIDSVVADAKGWDPDAFGGLDDVESLVGLGFVACQRYLTAASGWTKLTKHSALGVGPRHRCGLTIAEITNHAANYWKHQDEWHSEKKTQQQKRTETAIACVVGLLSDYPMTQVLTELAGEQDFKPVLRDLAAWHDELCSMIKT